MNSDQTPLTDAARSMPFSAEAEQGVLSCILQSPVQLLDECRDRLPIEAFYHPAHQTIYSEFLDMGQERKPLDLVTISNRFIDKGIVERIGGNHVVAELLSFVPTPAHFGYYVGILKNKHLLRRMISVCTHGIQQSYEYAEDPTTVLEVLQKEVLAISLDREDRGPTHCKEAVNQVLDQIEYAMTHIGQVTGLQFGLADLDRPFNGLEKKDRVVIGAHPSVGKTTLLMNIAESLAVDQNAPGLIFSNDGDQTGLMRRGISARSGVPLKMIRTGIGLKEEGRIRLKNITDSSGQWQKSQLFLDDRPGLTIQQMCAAARRMKQQHDIQWVACDFFQNIKCPNGKGSRDPVEELSDVSQLWMNMLLELNIGGIMLAQLNRDAKGKPSMHHIKGSGKLLEDATKMILMSRDDRPLDQLLKDEEDHIDAYDAKQCPPLEPEERLILAEIVKNKDGPTCPVWLRLKAPETRFRCLVPDKKLYDASHNRQARNADGRL